MVRWLLSSISRKLGFVLLTMVALVLVTGAVGLSALKSLNRQLADSTEQQAAASALVNQMLGEVRQLADHAHRAASAETPEARERALTDLASSQERLGALVDTISSKFKDVPEVHDAIEQGFSSFVISAVKSSRLLRAGRIEDAQKEISNNLEPKLLAYVLTTVAAIEQHAGNANAKVREASQIGFKRSRGLLALSIVFAVVAAVIGQLMLSRTVVRPVRRAAIAAECLANGQFNIDVTGLARDECGEMLNAMARLRDSLQTVAKVQQDLLHGAETDEAPQAQTQERLAGAYGELVEAVAHAVHRNQTSYHAVRRELLEVTSAIGRGDFSHKLETAGKEGMWRELAEVLNQLTDNLAAALHDVSRQLSELSQGNLRRSSHSQYEGLLGQFVQTLAETVGSLSGMVHTIRGSADSVADEARRIAEGNEVLSQQTDKQATALEQSATAVSRLTETASETAHNAEQTNRLMQTASEAATRGSSLTSQVVATMESIQSVSQRITSIVELINSVAFQTNILALNAAVEAARAGEHGKGFAVVASEVRALAGRTAEAAREIERLVTDTRTNVDRGVTLVGQAGESMQTIVRDVTAATKMIGDISRASQDQSRDIGDVNGMISRLRETTRHSSEMVSGAALAAHKLTDESSSLLESVSVFKLAEQAAPPASRRSPDSQPWQSAPEALRA
jgi:methyl-accepting chemotaxis protein